MAASETSDLITVIVIGGVAGLLQGLVVWGQRYRKGEPLVQRKKLNSPRDFYVGLLTFSAFGVLAFATGRPLLAAFFAAFALAYVIGLVAYQRGWRG